METHYPHITRSKSDVQEIPKPGKIYRFGLAAVAVGIIYLAMSA